MNLYGPPRVVGFDRLHPAMRPLVAELTARLGAKSVPMKVYETFRELDRQAWLYSLGRTVQNPDSKPGTGPYGLGVVVTNAQGKEGPHPWGCAVDFVIDVPALPAPLRGKVTSAWDEGPEGLAIWAAFGAEARDVVLTWGGDWHDRDRPHVEHPSWRALVGAS